MKHEALHFRFWTDPDNVAAATRLVGVLAIVIAGLAIRLIFRDHTTNDTATFLLPWYNQALNGGTAALGRGLTNYAPLYSYLLLIATAFDGILAPLLLIKSISFFFEFGCAVVVYMIVAAITGSRVRATLAFAAVWLAPSVLYNGALWGQADSIWTFFVLLSIYYIAGERYRLGIVAFAIAVSVKLQGIFLGPLIFALVLRRRLHWTWLASIPVTYLLLALPVFISGRPAIDILMIYFRQAEFFHDLSVSAPNLWLFVPTKFYALGVVIGIVSGAGAGLAVSLAISRRDWSAEAVVISAATSLILMPWILPKMHDRYFYAFELTSIALAFIRPRMAVIAIVSQLVAVLTYLTFDVQRGVALVGLPLAAILNTMTVMVTVAAFTSGRIDLRAYGSAVAASLAVFMIWLVAVPAFVAEPNLLKWWPGNRFDTAGLLGYLATTLATTALVYGSVVRLRRVRPK